MMITAMKAFNIEADKALSIVDKYNEIGNNFALSATDIGDAMQRSASVLAASNTSFDESIALITAGNEILQDPEKTGTALRTIALRIRGAKSELEEMGEDTDYLVHSTSKLRDLIKGYTSINGKYEGFDIMEDENTFKSLAEIIKGIGEVYDEMSDIDRTAMLEKLAGKNRSNALAAMLQNYEQIDNVLKSIEQSEGSALEENAHIVDSVQGRLTILQTSAENFWQTFLDTDALKNTITALTEILNLLTKIVDKTGMAPILTGAAGLSLTHMSGGFQRYFDNRNFKSTLTTQKKAFEAEYNNLLSDWQTNWIPLRGEMSNSEFIATNPKAAEAFSKLTSSCNKLEKAEESLNDQTLITAKSFKTDFLKALGGAAASLAISGLVALISMQIQKYKEAIHANRDFNKEVSENNKSLKDYAKQIADANKIIHDEKSSTDEIREAKNKLIEIQGQLNEKYNDFSTAIQDVNEGLKEENQLLTNDAIKKAREAAAGAEGTYNLAYGNEANAARAAYDGYVDIGKLAGLGSKTSNAIELMRQFMPEGSVTEVNALGAGFDTVHFEFNNYDELVNGLEQALITATSEAYAGNKDAENAAKLIKEALDKARADAAQYADIIANVGMSDLSSRYYKEYNSLTNAYWNDIENPTESSRMTVENNLLELWRIASEENNEGARMFLKSFFSDYADAINEYETDKLWETATNYSDAVGNKTIGSQIEHIADMINIEGEKELGANEILNYLYGGNINANDRQISWLKDFKDYIDRNNLNYQQVMEKLESMGIFRNSFDIQFEDDLEAARLAAKEKFGEDFDFEGLGIGTDEELTKWNNIVKVATDGAEAVKMYALATSDLNNAADASRMLKDMESQYKPVFDAMAEAYKAIWKDENFDITKVTSEQLESVRSQIESMNNDLQERGYEGIPTDEINDFILTLEDATTTEEEAHEAFNSLATDLVDSLVPAIGQASGSTALLIQNTLKELGVTNYEEVAISRLGFTYEQYCKAKEEADSVGLDVDADLASLDAEQISLIANNETLSDFYAKRILANNVSIETMDDVRALNALCKALGVAKFNTIDLANAEKRLNDIDWLWQHGRGDEAAAKEKELLKEYQDAQARYKPQLKYDGNKAESSDKDKDKDTKQKFDWIERAIKKIQRAVTNLGKVADATYKTWGERLDAIMGKTEEFHDEIGQFGRGNIDLYNRPQYYTEDGTVETVYSETFEQDGKWVLVPTIDWSAITGEPYEMTSEEAWNKYLNTGEYLGIFDTLEEADEYAEKLHLQQEAIYTDYDKFTSGKYQKLKEEISLQEQASQAYMAEAKAIGLSAEYVNKIQNGKMDIETVTDEKLKEAISDYQEYYDKATDAADAVEDLRSEIAQLAQTKFDIITKQFEEMALAIDHAATRIGHIQSKMDSEGYFESSALLNQLKSGNESKLVQLQEEAKALAASIDEAVSNGDIAYGSEQWWGMYDALQNVNDQIVEMGSTIADLNDQLRQLEWDKFDYIADAVNRLTEENNFLIDVLQGEEQMFEKIAYIGEDLYANGNMSDAALAVQGLHVNNLQILEEQNRTYAAEIKKINKELANDPSNKKLLERRNDLIDQQQDIIKGIDDEKHAIKDLIQEGYETFLDYLQKSIDKRKEALEAQKSLYDYENTVEEQTKAIASYQKQISALGGDESEETQARLQELANNLNAAEKELQKTEYEQWLSDQEKMMDNMYNSFEKLINDRLDDLDGLVEQAIQQTADSATAISQTIQAEADEFIYELDNTSFGVNIDARMSDAIYAVNSVENAINNMVNAANVNAQNELAQLQALAATIATQAAVSAATVPQVTVPTGNTGGDGGSGGGSDSGGSTGNSSKKTISKTVASKLDAALKQLEEQYRDLERLYDYNKQMEKSYNGRAAMTANGNERNSLMMSATNFSVNAKKYKKQMDALDKQIQELKNARYAKGGTIGNAVKKTGEDGIILARSGEEVLSLERVKQMQQIFKMMEPLTNLGSNTHIGGNTTVNGMNITFDLPNVTSYEDFVNKAKSDPTFEKLVQNMTIGTSLGKNKLGKYSI